MTTYLPIHNTLLQELFYFHQYFEGEESRRVQRCIDLLRIEHITSTRIEIDDAVECEVFPVDAR